MQIAPYKSRAVRLRGLANKGAVMPRIAPYGICFNACSACSGDYEDPERTAWSDAAGEEADDEESAGNVLRSVAHEKFPVREE